MAKDGFVNQIADIDSDFTRWYTDVVLKTELVDYGPVKGTMVIRPYGYALWENIQAACNERFKNLGVSNAYFPMLIPQSFLMREAEHVEGFAPEVATVTHVGNTELPEKLVLRPTSETIIGEMYAKWTQSYRDLPLKLNQWANIVRWEKTTRPFLRTSEFLWQEGHCIFAAESEALNDAHTVLDTYGELCETCLAMPVLKGQKTEKEKFAGAEATFSIEAMMKDGKSLQAGTTHYLGQNFAKAFNIKFLDSDGVQKYVYQSSWGVSTRLIGALIMTHGDSRGLVLPPFIAPIQAVIIPVAAAKSPNVMTTCIKVKQELEKRGVRAKLDDSDNSPGFKFNHWELRGVPLRIEIGPRDIENGRATVARRDTCVKSEVALDTLNDAVENLLKTIQTDMTEAARARMTERTKNVGDMSELKEALDGGNFANAGWCGDGECEAAIKAKLQATARNMPFNQPKDCGKCVHCGKKAKKRVIFARAY